MFSLCFYFYDCAKWNWIESVFLGRVGKTFAEQEINYKLFFWVFNLKHDRLLLKKKHDFDEKS